MPQNILSLFEPLFSKLERFSPQHYSNLVYGLKCFHAALQQWPGILDTGEGVWKLRNALAYSCFFALLIWEQNVSKHLIFEPLFSKLERFSPEHYSYLVYRLKCFHAALQQWPEILDTGKGVRKLRNALAYSCFLLIWFEKTMPQNIFVLFEPLFSKLECFSPHHNSNLVYRLKCYHAALQQWLGILDSGEGVQKLKTALAYSCFLLI
jgi:hypothetical protein